MSVLTLMESSGVLFVFLPVRLDVAKASRPKITTASSCVNTDILVLDNLSNVLLGIFMPPPKEIYFDHRRKKYCIRIVSVNQWQCLNYTYFEYVFMHTVCIHTISAGGGATSVGCTWLEEAEGSFKVATISFSVFTMAGNSGNTNMENIILVLI